MTHPTGDALAAEERVVEAVAKSIAKMVPFDGGMWTAGNGENFPLQYDRREQDKIRAISRAAIQAYRKAMREGE